jgi:hypothetical protein
MLPSTETLPSRVAAYLFLPAAAAFCLFGFRATFEPTDRPGQFLASRSGMALSTSAVVPGDWSGRNGFLEVPALNHVEARMAYVADTFSMSRSRCCGTIAANNPPGASHE